jgi:hypothetical protein
MAVDTAAVLERIGQLESELERLRAQLHSAENTKSYKDLRGSMKGMLDMTDEEMEECLLKLDWKALGVEDDE